MDAAMPLPLTIQDLDREELVEVLMRYAPFLRPSDLWGARHEVATRRATATFKRETEAGSAYFDCCHAQFKRASDTGRPTSSTGMRERNRLDAARTSAGLAQRRAKAAQERAWKNLQACWDGGR